jgi:hypothetical protein
METNETGPWPDLSWNYALLVKWLDQLRESLPADPHIACEVTRAGKMILALDAVEITEHMRGAG